jgi:lysozyme family protein
MNFDDSFDRLIGHEGGYTNNPKDSGNWTSGRVGVGDLKGTKFGVAASSYPNVDIKNLTLDQAKEIYRRDYWDALSLGSLPEAVRFDLFDTAVNSGVGTAKILLQRALGVKADGVVGPKTIAAANEIDPQLLDKRFSAQRLLFICDLKAFTDFGKGWIRRVASNLLED